LTTRNATKLARDIAKEIERKLDYPGEIRVTVIRWRPGP